MMVTSGLFAAFTHCDDVVPQGRSSSGQATRQFEAEAGGGVHPRGRNVVAITDPGDRA